MNNDFNLSANIENGFPMRSQYVVTPNGRRAVQSIIKDFHSGIHSFTIIGSYGTGKSSFLLALESDLDGKNKQKLLLDPANLSSATEYEIVNIVGDYAAMSTLLGKKLNIDGRFDSILDELKSLYTRLKPQNKFLLIVVDEFGKVLEHAAKNNPEQELYFLQKLAEFVNVPTRNILLLTTLHQNFSSYSKELTESQKNEWTKVKGRFREITFVEPIEQLLNLASKQLPKVHNEFSSERAFDLHQLAIETKIVSSSFSEDVACQLYPLDTFSAYAITMAMQKYGQNERSLFTFLNNRGHNSLSEFQSKQNLTYHLGIVYDYINYNFYSFLKDANADSMSWGSMQVSIERVEGVEWNTSKQLNDAINIVKAIGLLNLFGIASFQLDGEQMAKYAQLAMDIEDAKGLIEKLIRLKIVRYASYKNRLMLFEGTDIDLELEIQKAGAVVSRPVSFIDDLRQFISHRVSPVKAHCFHNGTPRYFEYEIREEPLDMVPVGDTDGFIELMFSPKPNALEEIKAYSLNSTEHAIVYAYFNNTEEIIDHLYNISKYKYILEKVLIDKDADHVAFGEIVKLKEHEEDVLNKTISDNLFAYKNRVVWVFKGEQKKVRSLKEFNELLSDVCDEVYSKSPVMINELFNRHKLSSPISIARKNYLAALIEKHQEEDLGFDQDKFPPEKTIYYSLLKNTGLHKNGVFLDKPVGNGLKDMWEECNQFLQSSTNKPRRISELIKILSNQPYKMKQGFLDFWIPTFLFIKRQDFALSDANSGAYIPNMDMTFFDLLQKHPADYCVKAFDVDGVKLDFFNQYRRFVNLNDEVSVTTDSFVETIKPFLFFYKKLNDYTKHTKKFAHKSTMKFRDVLATAKDPEKAFFEDLPESLNFSTNSIKSGEGMEEYGKVIQRSIRELRSCYSQLIDRIEERIVEELGLESSDYNEYVIELRKRLENVKVYLLNTQQKEFYNRVITEYDNRVLWYQSICYPILEHKLESLRDEEEEKLLDDIVFLFRECEKYSDISKKSKSDTDDAYSIDLVTNKGTSIRTQTFVVSEKEKKQVEALEKEIISKLQGKSDIEICALLSVLNSKLNQ
jgi:hypothetical protein